MKRSIANFVAFQLGWFACVLPAAAGMPWLGVAFVACWVAVHIATSDHPKGELLMALIVAPAGFAADSMLVLSGLMAIPPEAQLGSPSTLWLAAMWVNLGATLNQSLRWLQGRLLLSSLFGVIGGPLAYYAGMRFGAVAFPEGTTLAMLGVAVEWGIATPLLVYLAHSLAQQRDDTSQAARAETAEGGAS